MTREERTAQIIDDSEHDAREIRRCTDEDLTPILKRDLGPAARGAIQGLVDAKRWLIRWPELRIKHAADIALGEELKRKMGIEVFTYGNE